MLQMSLKAKWFVAGIVFTICIAPTIVSYQPYTFRWDDSDYLLQSINVSRAFWAAHSSGREHFREVLGAMYGIRPPAMTVLGLPWGPLQSWDAAGKCFVTLDCWISVIAALCIALLLRISVQPLLLSLASLCVFAVLGPWPARNQSHSDATSLMADTLFAWTCLAALLLIPYEARTERDSTGHAMFRGILWGTILSLGTMTKIHFLFFVGLILPVLLVVRSRQNGIRNCSAAFIGFLISSSPSAIYLVKFGRLSLSNAATTSFGSVSALYEVPLFTFLRETVRTSPGLVVFAASLILAVLYLATKGCRFVCWPDLSALLIATAFGLVVLSSTNRQFRYAFPTVVSLPFLLAVMLSPPSERPSRRSILLIAGPVLIAFVMVALPACKRAARGDSLARADAVIADVVRCGNSKLMIATDSTTLNDKLLRIAVAITDQASLVQVNELQESIMLNVPIERDFERIHQSDSVVFQDNVRKNQWSFPPFTNARTPEYRRYIEHQASFAPTKIDGDVTVFSKRCGP